jgi:membrane protein implicated in regulation of membrane protease activity
MWDGKIQRYYAIAFSADGVLFILFFGLSNYFSAADMMIFGLLFVLSLVLSFVLVLIGQRKKRNFQDSWKKEHPLIQRARSAGTRG